MQYTEEMDLYEQLTDKDPVDTIQREDQEAYRRYVHERRRRLQRRRRREKERQNRIRRIRLITGFTVAAIVLIAVFVRVAAGNPVRDSLTLQAGSPMPEARAFLRNEKSRAEIYFLSDMTQVDMNTPGETEILLEVNGKQFESRLIVQNPSGTEESDSGTEVTVPDSAAEPDTSVSTVSVSAEPESAITPETDRDTLQAAGATGANQND